VEELKRWGEEITSGVVGRLSSEVTSVGGWTAWP